MYMMILTLFLVTPEGDQFTFEYQPKVVYKSFPECVNAGYKMIKDLKPDQVYKKPPN